MSSEEEKKKIMENDLETGRKKECQQHAAQKGQQRATLNDFKRPGLQESNRGFGNKPAFLLDVVERKNSVTSKKKGSVDEKIRKEKEKDDPEGLRATKEWHQQPPPSEGVPNLSTNEDNNTTGGDDGGTTVSRPEATRVDGQMTSYIPETSVTDAESAAPPQISSEVVEQQDAEQLAVSSPSGDVEQQDVEQAEQQQQEEEEEEEEDVISAYVPGERRRRNRNSQLIEDAKVEREQKDGNKRCIILFACLLVAVAIAISLIFVFKQADENQQGGGIAQALTITDNPSNSPTMIPTAIVNTETPSSSPSESHAPTSERLSMILDEIRLQFRSSTSFEEDLSSRSSPQYQAALWMAEEDNSEMTRGLQFPLNSTDVDSIFQFRQRYALAVLYYSTEGDEWTEDCNFMNTTAHVCDWTCPLAAGVFFQEIFEHRGVVCHDVEGFVIAMDLTNNNLSGRLPEELQGLDFMGTLVLSSNSIQGSIPFMAFNDTLLHREFSGGFDPGTTPLMSVMILLGNQLSGSLPEGINSLNNLAFLWVEDNLLTGSIPSSLATDTLGGLTMNNNLLTGTVPDSLFQMQSIQFIDLSLNLLSGTLPNDISLPILAYLYLRENFIEGTIPDAMGSMEGVMNLDLSYNTLTGTILPSSLGLLTGLRRLTLCGNKLTGEALNWSVIGEMNLMEFLCLGENYITGTIPPEIGTLASLTYLDLGNHDEERDETRTTFIKGSLPTELGQLQQLTSLIVNNNNIGGTVPTELANVLLLRHLFLDHNPFWGILPTALNRLQNLGSLRLEQTNLIGDLSVLCNRLPEVVDETAFGVRGFQADCLEETEISCCCCVVCCNNDGSCEDNGGSGCN